MGMVALHSCSQEEELDFPVTTSGIKSDRIYTLDGRYVGTDINALAKGMYIVNGKKILK